MPGIVFIGDEISATGFRLAGVSVRVPLAGEEQNELAEALSSAELVLITETLARRLQPTILAQYQALSQPILGVVPDIADRRCPEDLAVEVRRHLGIQSRGS